MLNDYCWDSLPVLPADYFATAAELDAYIDAAVASCDAAIAALDALLAD